MHCIAYNPYLFSVGLAHIYIPRTRTPRGFGEVLPLKVLYLPRCGYRFFRCLVYPTIILYHIFIIKSNNLLYAFRLLLWTICPYMTTVAHAITTALMPYCNSIHNTPVFVYSYIFHSLPLSFVLWC